MLEVHIKTFRRNFHVVESQQTPESLLTKPSVRLEHAHDEILDFSQ